MTYTIKSNIALKHILQIPLLFIILFSLSCSNGKDNQGSQRENEDTDLITPTSKSEVYFTKIFKPKKNKVFRNIVFDFPLDSIMNIEKRKELILTDQKESYLQYEFDLSLDTIKGIDYVMVKYIFDDADRLDIITVNYYIQDSLSTHNFYDHLNHSLADQYGDYYIDSDGYTVWESSYKRSDSVDVAYDIAIRKFIKFQDPGVTIEFMRFGEM